jgi:hypothetical protein
MLPQHAPDGRVFVFEAPGSVGKFSCAVDDCAVSNGNFVRVLQRMALNVTAILEILQLILVEGTMEAVDALDDRVEISNLRGVEAKPLQHRLVKAD